MLHAGTLVVEHRDGDGKLVRYDFAVLPGAKPLKRSLAEVFAARCTRSGGWTSHKTSEQAWWAVRQFVTWLAAQDDAPKDLEGLTASTWKRWRLSRPSGPGGRAQLKLMASLLREHPRVPLAAREAIAERIGKAKPVEQSFSQAEFARLTATARRVFRTAYLRITQNARTLVAWRRGELDEGCQPWLLGEELDHLARHGDLGQAPGSAASTIRRRRAASGVDNMRQFRQRLFLTGHEATALAALLTVEYGFNLSTISRLRVPRASSDGGEDGHLVWRLELEKPRRGAGRHFETRNLADFGANSPGRLITQALEATQFARALLAEQHPEVDRLMVWRATVQNPSRVTASYGEAFGVLRVGVTPVMGKRWAQAEKLASSPFRRGRRTSNVHLRREPGQNTQDTHDSIYVLPDVRMQEQAIESIAAGVGDALASARRAVLSARLRPEADAGDVPTVTADCHDIDHSQFTAPGTACTASFLLCLACTNARIHPGHHPRLAHLHHCLEQLSSVLDPARWASRWQQTHERLEDLRARLGTAVWDQALDTVTEADRDLVDLLLKGDFDR
ncbi:hypothetical protein [Streptomyces albireticuli]|uniref:hypothetical protein n=1 Tax=Streptomyces albireticuli TaxID=1940 RepID=UPI00117D734E|nr:hypothetical protein [Streptomyces albireticuli]MCD9193411.1 hypothetical protein [Streptomyces albireticuli]